MHADLPTGDVGADDRIAKLLVGAPVERTGELARWSVGRRERGRPTGERPVGVELHRPDRQPVVAEPSGDAQRLERVEL